MSATTTTNNNNDNTTANIFTATLSLVVYTYSVASLVSFWLFLVPNEFLPDAIAMVKLYSMDIAPVMVGGTSFTQVMISNLAAPFVFGFFHSLLARKSVKQWMGLPTCVERSFFCLQGAFLLHMIQHFWVNADDDSVGALWDITGTAPTLTTLVLGGYWLGSAILLSATFALDHFHLFGLSQGFGVDINRLIGLAPTASSEGEGNEQLKTRWHYHYVAHPIMTGFLMNVWVTPIMTAPRLGLALFMTLYIAIAVIRFEERSLREELGEEYDAYLAKTPRFFPLVSMMTNTAVHVRFKMTMNNHNNNKNKKIAAKED